MCFGKYFHFCDETTAVLIFQGGSDETRPHVMSRVKMQYRELWNFQKEKRHFESSWYKETAKTQYWAFFYLQFKVSGGKMPGHWTWYFSRLFGLNVFQHWICFSFDNLFFDNKGFIPFFSRGVASRFLCTGTCRCLSWCRQSHIIALPTLLLVPFHLG